MEYRCWHCEEVFTEKTAASHFGVKTSDKTGLQNVRPSCQTVDLILKEVESIQAPKDEIEAWSSWRKLKQRLLNIITAKAP